MQNLDPAIFGKPRSAFRQYHRSKFSNTGLDSVVKDRFGSTPLKDALVEVLVTSYNTQLREPAYFSSHHSRTTPNSQMTFAAAAMATSAAPTYFPPFKIGKDFYIDGGVVANNPACAAYGHAKKLWPKEDVLLVSIGTGSIASPLDKLRSKDWGLLQWSRPIIDCLMDGTSQTTDDFFRWADPKNYIRLQGRLNESCEKLDCTSPECINSLRAVAKAVIRDRSDAIDVFLDRLIQDGRFLESQIEKPGSGIVSFGPLRIKGVVYNYKDSDLIYAFTGGPERFWPSARVKPPKGVGKRT